MSKCLVSGSFDPITIGHLDIISKAANKFDVVLVGVFVNEQKSYLFDLDTRVRLCEVAVKSFKNVSVISSTGMVSDFCKCNKINAIVRGFRNCTDYKYETEMAVYNYLHSGVLTYLIPAENELLNVSSSLVRQYIANNFDEQACQKSKNIESESNVEINFGKNQNGFRQPICIEKCLPKSVLEEIRRIKNA